MGQGEGVHKRPKISDLFEKSEMKKLYKNGQKIQKNVNDKIPFFAQNKL